MKKIYIIALLLTGLVACKKQNEEPRIPAHLIEAVNSANLQPTYLYGSAPWVNWGTIYSPVYYTGNGNDWDMNGYDAFGVGRSKQMCFRLNNCNHVAAGWEATIGSGNLVIYLMDSLGNVLVQDSITCTGSNVWTPAFYHTPGSMPFSTLRLRWPENSDGYITYCNIYSF